MRALCFFLLLMFSSSTVFSEQQISVVIHEGKRWANADGSGFAMEMFNRIMKIANLNNTLKVYPLHLSRTLFREGAADCYFSANEHYFENIFTKGEIDVIASFPFTGDGVYAFSLKRKPKYSNFEELRNLNIASSLPEVLLKSVLPEGFMDETTYVYVRSDGPVISMFDSGRLDAYIAFKGAFNPEQLDRLHYDKSFAIFTVTDSLNCVNTPANQRFVEKVSSAIKQGLNTGEFDDLYESYSRDKPNLPSE